jgi:histidine kinase
MQLNMRAGKKARLSIAYDNAINYFRAAINSLGENKWQDNYRLTFNTYIQMAECFDLATHFDKSFETIAEIFPHITDPVDLAKLYQLKINMSDNLGLLSESIKYGREALALFEINIPENTAEIIRQTELEIASILPKIFEKPIEDLFDLPVMEDKQMNTVISLFMSFMGSAYQIDQDLAKLMNAKMVSLSLAYGNSLYSSYAYVGFGVYLGSEFNEYKNGYKFGKLAIRLCEKFDNPYLKVPILFIFGGFISPWYKPVNESIELTKKAIGMSLEVGDYISMANALFLVVINSFFKGLPLKELYEESKNVVNRLFRINNKFTVENILISIKFMETLLDKRENQVEILEDSAAEQKYLAEIIRTGNNSTLVHYYLTKTKQQFYFGNINGAFQSMLRSEEILRYTIGSLIRAEHYFYGALIMTNLYPESDHRQQLLFKEKLDDYKEKLNNWASNCPENFLHLYLLVEAEILGIYGKQWEAVKHYEQAIKLAKQNDFIHIEALANECFARFWLINGNNETAGLYLNRAYNIYSSWGAAGKARFLKEKYSDLIFDKDSEKTLSTQSDQFDILTIIKSSQIISGEIHLNSLIEKMMKIVMENAGAQKGVLLLRNDKKWYVKAESNFKENNNTVMLNLDLDIADNLPASVINRVIMLKESIVVNNAFLEIEYKNDKYLQGNNVKSFITIPIINQDSLTGVLYLENKLATNAFTMKQFSLLNMLSSQIAISIENALLFEKTTKMERIKKEMEMAAAIQKIMLPAILPVINDYDVSARYQMAREAGGDFYDVRKINNENYLLVTGDVSGKGMPAALYMSAVINILRTEVECLNFDLHKIEPANLLKITNRLIKSTMQKGNFVTLFIGILNTGEHTLSYSTAGHEAAILWNPETKRYKTLKTYGQPCGLIAEEDYEIEQDFINLDKGDFILINTDGITEAKNDQAKEFSFNSYNEVILSLKENDSTSDAVKMILEKVKLFTGDIPQYDDISILCIKRNS